MAKQFIDIIIPVYRDAALTRACIESVLRSRDPKMGRVIVINDGSPEQAVKDYCEELVAGGDVELISHDHNLGFVATVNRGMRATENDVVLLNSDTEVSGNWLSRLQHVAQTRADCSTVTPFSNNATICSFPKFCEDNPLPSGMTLARTDAVFAEVNAGESCEIPTGVGFCMYITRASLDRVGAFDEAAFGRGYGEENDFCRRAVAAGFKHYHCADVYVQHKGGVSFANDAPALQASAARALLSKHPDYDAVIQSFIKKDPAREFRERVSYAIDHPECRDSFFERAEESDKAAADLPLSRAGDPLISTESRYQASGSSQTEAPGIGLCLVVPPGEESQFLSTWAEIQDYPWVDITVLCGETVDLTVIQAAVDNHSAAGRVLPVFTEQAEPQHYWITLLPHLGHVNGSVFILRCGTRVPAWLYNRLLNEISDEPAWLFPLTAIQPFSRLFQHGRQTPRLSVHEVEAWLNHYRYTQRVDLPLLAGYSALVNAKAGFASVATDDVQLIEELKRRNVKVLLTPDFYADDSAHEPLMLPPELPLVRHEVIRNHPRFAAVRQAISASEMRGERAPSAGLRIAPATLHVCHSWGGGLNRWVEDYCAGDSSSQNIILKSVGDRSAYGKSMALFLPQSPKVPIKTWSLVSPILSTDIRNEEYDSILREIEDNFSVKQVVVSSLIGHSLDVLRWHTHTTLVTHDFYPLCPPLYAKFGSICDSCQPERFQECLRLNQGHEFFNHESPEYLADIKRRFLSMICELPIRIVSPSRATRDRWRLLANADFPDRIDVIPHGLGSEWLAMLESVREAAVSPPQQDQTADSGYQRKLKVLVLGRLFSHKGSDILQSSLGELREFAEIHLLGSGDEAIAVFENKVDTFQPHYEQDDLPQLVVDLAPDVAVMLSTVPETFSYTAEELQLMGIPLVTTAVGSLPERIDANRTGWHVEPTSESLVAELSLLQRNRALLSDARRQLRDQPRPFTAGEMVEQYKRYALPTERMPLRRAGTLQHSGVILDSDEIYVRPDIPVKQAVLAFLRWLRRRVAASPRLPSWLRRLLG